MAGPSKGLTVLFLFFHIAGGIVGLPIVVLSIIASRQPSRHPTLLNFCATWFFSSLIYTLLVYAGKQRDDHPPFSLCLAQAAMANGAFPMTSVAGVALVAHIWHGLGTMRPWSQFGLASPNLQTARLTALLLAPYVVFLALTIAGAVIGHKHPDRIQSTEKLFYCTLNTNAFDIFVPTFTTVAMAFILLFEVLICFKIYQNTYIRAGLNRSGFRLFLLRLAGFTIYAIITLIVSALLLANSRDLAPYILQATLPLAIFFFIGTQKEVLATWRYWFSACFGGAYPFDGPIHRRSRSAANLMQDDRPPTPYFATPEFVHLNEVGADKPTGAEIFKSSVPAHVPKRPPAKPLDTMPSFFPKPLPSEPVQAEPQRSNFDLSRQPQQVQQQTKPTHRPLPPEPVRPYDVQFPGEQSHPQNNVGNAHLAQHLFGQPLPGFEADPASIIATQKQTISRLLEEAGYMSRALDRLKNIEQKFHKAQNALTTERRTASQLRTYVNQLEFDLATQQSIVNERIVQNKELEDRCKLLEEKADKLDKLCKSLDSALNDSVDKEMRWMKKYDALKAEHNALLEDRESLANDLQIFMDYFVSRDSPLEWDGPKGAGPGVRSSPQNAFPEEMREKIRQRASTPISRPFSRSGARQTKRQTDAAQASNGRPNLTSKWSTDTEVTLAQAKSQSKPTGITVESLDRLRPRMLELSGKMELSEKILRLEELVREQSAIIDQLENTVDGERRVQMRQRITDSLRPSTVTQKFYDLGQLLARRRFGWVVLVVMMLIISFPPLTFYWTVVSLCGFTYGLGKGLVLAAPAAIIGSTIVFIVLRLSFRSTLRNWTEKNEKWQALETVMRKKGLPLIILIRVSPFPPWSYSNACFASVEAVSLWQFLVANIFLLPKIFLVVFSGSRVAKLADGEQRNKMDTAAMVLNIVLIVISIGLGILAGVITYRLLQKQIQKLRESPDLDDELAAEALEAAEEGAPLLQNVSSESVDTIRQNSYE
ncbi:hypothetical protein ACEPAI_6141 [Sanghuangporus weigelae]